MSQVARLEMVLPEKKRAKLARDMKQNVKLSRGQRLPTSRTKASPVGIGRTCPSKLKAWLVDKKLCRLPNSETRTHMKEDLARYYFTSAFGDSIGSSPKAGD